MKKTKTIVKNVFDGKLTEREVFIRLLSNAGADDIVRTDAEKLVKNAMRVKHLPRQARIPLTLWQV